MRVETLIPVGEGAEARRDIVRDHFENAADGIAGAQRKINLILHARFALGIGAGKQDFVFCGQCGDRVPCDRLVESSAADRDNMTQDFDAKFAQKQFRDCSGRNTSRRFTC